MPLVVGVHGIRQQLRDPVTLESKWRALLGGLRIADHSKASDRLQETGALRVAFFGDLFRGQGTMGALNPPYGPGDLAVGSERELLGCLYDSAVADQATLGAVARAMGVSLSVQAMVAKVMAHPAVAPLTTRELVGGLKQVSSYLTNDSTRGRVLARVDQVVGEDTVVMIGHSLGSVVAYEYLCKFAPPSVRLFVTIGSPLGIRGAIFDRLEPQPSQGHGSWPDNIVEWVNVAAEHDFVALTKKLRPLFGPGDGGIQVRDRLVNSGVRGAHAVDRYLSSLQVAEAVGRHL